MPTAEILFMLHPLPKVTGGPHQSVDQPYMISRESATDLLSTIWAIVIKLHGENIAHIPISAQRGGSWSKDLRKVCRDGFI